MVQTEPPTQQTQASPPAITKPTREEVLDAIRREAGCTREKAGQLLSFLASALDCLRRTGKSIYHLNSVQINDLHDVYSAVMPDNSVAAPGSAHAKVQQFLLHGDEVALTHRQRGTEVRNCTVELDLLTG